MRVRWTTAALGSVVVLFSGAQLSPAAAGGDERTAAVRYVTAGQIAGVVPEGVQTTVVSPNGAHMTVTSGDLVPGNAYTLWFAFFNKPERCAGPSPGDGLKCGAPDLFNKAADPHVVYGAGLVADNGTNTFRVYYAVDKPISGVEQVAWPEDGAGVLVDAANAEYHSVIRDHGAFDPQYGSSQTKTLNGGCHEGEDGYPCADVQAAGFRTQIPASCHEIDQACFDKLASELVS